MVWDVVRGMFWPVGNLAVMMFTTPTKEGEFLMKDGKTKASAADAFGSKPIANTLKDHLAVQFGTIQKLLWAAVVWYYFTDLEGAKRGDFAWLSTILVRDILITLYHGGVWDLVVYSPYSPFRKFLKSYKFNPEYPNTGRFFHDLFWSLCSTVISSLFEAWTLRQWVGGVSLGMPLGAHTHDTWWRDGATLAWLVTMPYWRLGHFFFLHRSMHKWFPGRQPGTGVIPDIGEQIYNYVHSLHHKAKNPTALSGVAMHPIESSGYYTAMWIPHAVAAAARALPALFPAALGASIHPIVLLYTKMDLTIAALVGHDGHGYPGGGSQCHWLHHNNQECNYGEKYVIFSIHKPSLSANPVMDYFLLTFLIPYPHTPKRLFNSYAPFDYFWDSFAANEDDFQKLMERRAKSYEGVKKVD